MKILVIAISILFSSFGAQAGILIEPYGGIHTGSLSSTKNPTTGIYWTNDNPTGIEGMANSGGFVGGRLGLSFLGVWIAGDYVTISGNMRYDKPVGRGDGSFSGNYGFVDVGIDFPFLLRLWGGYGFSNSLLIKWTDRQGNNHSDSFKGGTAVKAGLGFSFLYFLSINFEYIKPTYKNVVWDAEGQNYLDKELDYQYNSFDQSYYMMSLSFPLNLL